MAKLVSKTYGDALFELALEANKLEQFLEEGLAVKQIFEENEELVKLLNHPKIHKEEKISFMEQIFDNRASKEMIGFLTLIVGKERHNEIIGILDYFIAQVKEYKKIGVATVVSAVELAAGQKHAIEEKLLATTEYQTFEMDYQIDASVIGGVVIRIGDRVVDNSIKHKLEELARELYGIQLA